MLDLVIGWIVVEHECNCLIGYMDDIESVNCAMHLLNKIYRLDLTFGGIHVCI